MNTAIWAYLSYLSIAVSTTVWVAWTLHKHGRIFLVDTFLGNEKLADSVNHLLVVGFYLINVGFISLALKSVNKPTDTVEGIEFVSMKVGLALLVLGGMHFFNLYIFTRMRKRALLRNAPPPVSPDEYVVPEH